MLAIRMHRTFPFTNNAGIEQFTGTFVRPESVVEPKYYFGPPAHRLLPRINAMLVVTFPVRF